MRITAPPSSFTALTDGTAPPSSLPSPSSFLIPTTAPSLVSKYLSLKIGSGLPLFLISPSSLSSPLPPFFFLLSPSSLLSLFLSSSLLLPPSPFLSPSSFFFLLLLPHPHS